VDAGALHLLFLILFKRSLLATTADQPGIAM